MIAIKNLIKEKKPNPLDVTMFYVVDKRGDKVTDMEVVYGREEEKKMMAYAKLKEMHPLMSQSECIMCIEVNDLMSAIPECTNHVI